MSFNVLVMLDGFTLQNEVRLPIRISLIKRIKPRELFL